MRVGRTPPSRPFAPEAPLRPPVRAMADALLLSPSPRSPSSWPRSCGERSAPIPRYSSDAGGAALLWVNRPDPYDAWRAAAPTRGKPANRVRPATVSRVLGDFHPGVVAYQPVELTLDGRQVMDRPTFRGRKSIVH